MLQWPHSHLQEVTCLVLVIMEALTYHDVSESLLSWSEALEFSAPAESLESVALGSYLYGAGMSASLHDVVTVVTDEVSGSESLLLSFPLSSDWTLYSHSHNEPWAAVPMSASLKATPTTGRFLDYVFLTVHSSQETPFQTVIFLQHY